ncbi:hypothetical protein SCALM49S_08226 [Streptomyces californicus]
MVHLGRPDDALDLMKLAKSGSRPRDPAPHPDDAAHHRGVGAGVHGPGQAMRRTLGEAEELFTSDKGDVPAPSWMQMFDEADLHGMQALAFRTLAEHDRSAAVIAQRHAKQALELRDGDRRRSKIFDYISLASACFIANDPEQADRYARLALVSMGETSSHRTWDRLREMYRLTGQFAGHAGVQDLRAEIEHVMPPAGKSWGAPRPDPAPPDFFPHIEPLPRSLTPRRGRPAHTRRPGVRPRRRPRRRSGRTPVPYGPVRTGGEGEQRLRARTPGVVPHQAGRVQDEHVTGEEPYLVLLVRDVGRGAEQHAVRRRQRPSRTVAEEQGAG